LQIVDGIRLTYLPQRLGKPKTKIFKITISTQNTPDVILYQPSWYAAQVKRQIAEWVKKKSYKKISVCRKTRRH